MSDYSDYIPVTSAAKKVRATLRTAFPKTKISTTSGTCGISVEWANDIGPSVKEVENVLCAAPFITSAEGWDDTKILKADGYLIQLWSFNAAEREAEQRERELRRQKEEEEWQRGSAALAEARRAEEPALEAIEAPRQSRQQESNAAVFEAFNRLRQRAEAGVEFAEGDRRRPSWAPPMILGDELAAICRTLGWLGAEDKPIGRLWAQFASPRRSAGYLREHVSGHGLGDITCRSFELFAGSERGLRGQILFEAQQAAPGEWRFGPSVYFSAYESPHEREWEGLVRERERLTHDLVHVNFNDEARAREEKRLAEIDRKIAEIDHADAQKAQQRREKQQLRLRAYELTRARMLDFVGAPDVQMQLAARLWGHCCRCGRELTDPVSLERGIGPDCWNDICNGIRRLAAEGERREVISWLVGVPLELLDTILGEQP